MVFTGGHLQRWVIMEEWNLHCLIRGIILLLVLKEEGTMMGGGVGHTVWIEVTVEALIGWRESQEKETDIPQEGVIIMMTTVLMTMTTTKVTIDGVVVGVVDEGRVIVGVPVTIDLAVGHQEVMKGKKEEGIGLVGV
jgi:hypothetical protein